MFSENSIFAEILCITICATICIGALIYGAYRIMRNPFRYPYFIYTFDVTARRNVHIEDCIDNFLCDSDNWHDIQSHTQYVQEWKTDTERYLQTCILQNYRTRQFRSVLDDCCTFRFRTARQQTRYRQSNYVRVPYKVAVIDYEQAVDWEWLSDRYRQLEEIGFESTLREYHSKHQRRLMTSALRREIMERDSYTCQICRKYMPDEVGLHIDHIVPIAKGGKSVSSNLRVLCSKCNGRKGAK